MSPVNDSDPMRNMTSRPRVDPPEGGSSVSRTDEIGPVRSAPSESPAVVGRISGSGNFGNISNSGNIGNIGSNIGQIAFGGVPSPAPASRQPAAEAKPEPSDPIRILFLGANPKDSVRLRLDEEVREIDQALRGSEMGGKFELCQKWAVRSSDLQAHLLRHRPQIVHFSGHGDQGDAILLEGDDGRTRPVDAVRFARQLGLFTPRLRVVVLNACYSQDQAKAIAEHVDCVIGMSDEIQDRVAVRFAASFYRALASGCNVRMAFELGRSDFEVGELGQEGILDLISMRRDPEEVVFVGV